jgi:hypothetical protein
MAVSSDTADATPLALQVPPALPALPPGIISPTQLEAYVKDKMHTLFGENSIQEEAVSKEMDNDRQQCNSDAFMKWYAWIPELERNGSHSDPAKSQVWVQWAHEVMARSLHHKMGLTEPGGSSKHASVAARMTAATTENAARSQFANWFALRGNRPFPQTGNTGSGLQTPTTMPTTKRRNTADPMDGVDTSWTAAEKPDAEEVQDEEEGPRAADADDMDMTGCSLNPNHTAQVLPFGYQSLEINKGVERVQTQIASLMGVDMNDPITMNTWLDQSVQSRREMMDLFHGYHHKVMLPELHFATNSLSEMLQVVSDEVISIHSDLQWMKAQERERSRGGAPQSCWSSLGGARV